MIRLKQGVLLTNVCPQMILVIQVVNEIYKSHGIHETWITSCDDSQHGPTTLHGKGRALDFRIHNVPEPLRAPIVSKLKACLNDKTNGGKEFEVYWESPGTENEHLHVEYDPK